MGAHPQPTSLFQKSHEPTASMETHSTTVFTLQVSTDERPPRLKPRPSCSLSCRIYGGKASHLASPVRPSRNYMTLPLLTSRDGRKLSSAALSRETQRVAFICGSFIHSKMPGTCRRFRQNRDLLSVLPERLCMSRMVQIHRSTQEVFHCVYVPHRLGRNTASMGTNQL